MRRWSVLLLGLVLSLPCVTQSLKIGDKAPDLAKLAWLTEMPSNLKQTTLVEFFHSSNEVSAERIDELRRLAVENHPQLNVVIFVREDDSEGFRMLAENREYYYVIQTDARYLRSLGVHYVPYTYVTTPKRRTMWCGNPLFLDKQTLITLINDGENNDKSLRKAASRRARR